jgi:hypothetical protein
MKFLELAFVVGDYQIMIILGFLHNDGDLWLMNPAGEWIPYCLQG